MAKPAKENMTVEQMWHAYLTTGQIPGVVSRPWYFSPRLRPVVRRLPSAPRCRLCSYPFDGPGGAVARHVLGVAPSRLNPQVCNVCDEFVSRYQGGAEVETSLLFADVRGSTALAEHMNPAQFGRLIGRFYEVASRVLIDSSAMIEKLIGDQVTGFYVEGLAGRDHARVAVDAAHAILRATGHESPGGAWIPVGVGVHTGTAYVGAIRSEGGVSDIAVLGDAANVAARLASEAGPGEVAISEAARAAAGLPVDRLEFRYLQLKGRHEPVEAWVRRVTPVS